MKYFAGLSVRNSESGNQKTLKEKITANLKLLIYNPSSHETRNLKFIFLTNSSSVFMLIFAEKNILPKSELPCTYVSCR